MGKRETYRKVKIVGAGVSVEVFCPDCEIHYMDIFTVKPLVKPRRMCNKCRSKASKTEVIMESGVGAFVMPKSGKPRRSTENV
jgi:hypothetical protein